MSILSRSALVLIALLTACREAAGPDPVAAEAVILAAASPTSIDGIVATNVQQLPAVLAQDASGIPVPGVLVTFYVMAGGGSISGQTATSNSAGIAQLEKWTLGLIAGTNEVVAASGTLTPVTFLARARAGPAASIVKVTGDGQIVGPGAITPLPPRIRVVDTYGNGVGGRNVTFSVGMGGGSVTGAAVQTDSIGLATVGSWRVGPRGSNSLIAASEGLSPQTFTAVSLAPFLPCDEENSLPAGVSVGARLTTESCRGADGAFYERIRIVIAQPGAYRFDLLTTEFDSHLELRSANPVAENNSANALNSAFKAFLTPGTYTLIVSTGVPGALGAYSITYREVAESVDGCEDAFLTAGTISIQQTTDTDCPLGLGEAADRFSIYLVAGTTVAFRATDRSYSNHGLTLFGPSGQAVASNGPPQGYVYSIVYTATTSGYHKLDVSNFGESGAEYQLTTQ